MHNEQSWVWQQSKTKSHPENLRVTRLDLLARPLDASGIVLPQFDFVEPARARLLFCERVDRMLAGKVDPQLLRLGRMQAGLEQAGGVWGRCPNGYRPPAR